MERQYLRPDFPTERPSEDALATGPATPLKLTDRPPGRLDVEGLIDQMNALKSALVIAGSHLADNGRFSIAHTISRACGRAASESAIKLIAAIQTMHVGIDELVANLITPEPRRPAPKGRTIHKLSVDWTEILDCFLGEASFSRSELLQCSKEVGFEKKPSDIGAQLHHLTRERIILHLSRNNYSINRTRYGQVRNDRVPSPYIEGRS